MPRERDGDRLLDGNSCIAEVRRELENLVDEGDEIQQRLHKPGDGNADVLLPHQLEAAREPPKPRFETLQNFGWTTGSALPSSVRRLETPLSNESVTSETRESIWRM